MNYEMIVNNMIDTIYSDIQELAELCVEKGITSCDELMEILTLIEIKRK